LNKQGVYSLHAEVISLPNCHSTNQLQVHTQLAQIFFLIGIRGSKISGTKGWKSLGKNRNQLTNW
jgi:hypothetical protein